MVVWIGGFRTWGLDALTLLVGGRSKYFFFLQELCNLRWASAFHAQLENVLDHDCRRFVHDPLRLVLQIFTIAERNIDGQQNAALILCLVDSTDFAAGILGKKLVEPVLLLGSMVSKWSLIAIYHTLYFGKVKLIYSPVSEELRPSLDRSFVQ